MEFYSAADIPRQSPYLSFEEEQGVFRRELEWGATPLVYTGYPDVIARQLAVHDELLARIDRSAPEGVPPVLQHFVEVSFMSRFAQRTMRNQSSYDERLLQNVSAAFADKPDVQAAFRDVHDRVLIGAGTAEEALLVRDVLGMRSIELARITHPYGGKIELLDGMREEVTESIAELGGESLLDPPTEYKVRAGDMIVDPDSDGLQVGLLMTRKSLIGELADGTEIYERSSFILRIDEASGFDQELAERMRAVKPSEAKDWSEEVKQAGRLEELLPRLLAENNFDCVIPMSTTVYAVNEADAETIEQIKKANAHQLNETRHANYPAIYQERQRKAAALRHLS